MKKAKKVFTLSIIVILTVALLSSFSPFPVLVEEVSASPGWLAGYGYRAQIPINSTTAGAQTDYAVKIKIHYGEGTNTAGNIYCNNHCRTDFADIRVTKSDEVTPVNYWLESKTDSDNAILWIELPTTPASGDEDYYLYYGKADASSGSDGDATFIFFDHFPGSVIDTSKWEGNTSAVTVANSILHVQGATEMVNTITDFPPDKRLRMKIAHPQSSYNYWGFGGTGAFLFTGRFDTGVNVVVFRVDTWIEVSTNWATDGLWYINDFLWGHSFDSCRWFENDSERTGSPYTDPSHIPEDSMPIRFLVDNNVDIQVDWVFISKLVDPEPSWATPGEEEEPIEPCTDHNVQGWAWSENIGWISFSCESGGGTVDYGVDIDEVTGEFSGYAWSENIGWISFADYNGDGVVNSNDNDSSYPCYPDCEAIVDLDTGEVSGWARALAYGDSWDGWIHLRNNTIPNPYGVYALTVDGYSKFYDWAWGGDDTPETAIIGWISFNCENTSCPYDYYVETSLVFAGPNQPPFADFNCNFDDCYSSDCIGYVGDDQCICVMENNSYDDDGDPITSTWYIEEITPGIPEDSCSGACNFTPAGFIGLPDYESSDTYTIKLDVTDGEAADTVSQSYEHRRGAIAGFRCSLDGSNWDMDCEDEDFTVEPGTVVYFKDNLFGSYPNDSSYPSCWGNSINLREWTINGNSFGGDNSEVSVTVDSNSTTTLTITDSNPHSFEGAGRTDSESHSISVEEVVVPKWKEVSP